MSHSRFIMANGAKRNSKVKTGCRTCRIRKVKCDEGKPSCQRCVGTGRTCDGYESPFILVKQAKATHTTIVKPNPGHQIMLPSTSTITTEDISLLNRCLSIKTMFDVTLCCDDDARQILQASLTNASIKYAVSSLQTLRQDFDVFGAGPATAQKTPNYNHGLAQYCMALGGLASHMSSDPEGLKSALLCCKVFISIEQVRGNFSAMAQHIIRGLQIMRECQARPQLVSAERLVTPQCGTIPFLDVYIIKLFAAPCKFTEAPTKANDIIEESSLPSPGQSPSNRNLRILAPDLRAKLTKISNSTYKFLDNISNTKSVSDAVRLLPDKMALLESLESWITDVEALQAGVCRELLSISFLRIFHTIMKIVILGSLDSYSSFQSRLEDEESKLQRLADDVTERVKIYCATAPNTPQ